MTKNLMSMRIHVRKYNLDMQVSLIFLMTFKLKCQFERVMDLNLRV